MDIDLIIPTYNRANLLKRCLGSVFLAGRPEGMNITVVVVDNNSDDNTKQVVQHFADLDELPVKYLFVKRAGKSAALNDAIGRTPGDLVGLIDDDEQIDSSWFTVVSREFTAAPRLDYIGGPYRPKWEHAAPDWLPTTYPGVIGIVRRPLRVAFSPDFDGMLMGGDAVIRRSVLQKVLPYPEKLGKIGTKIRSGEDEVIYHRLLGIHARGMVVPDLIIYHWISTDRLTKKYHRKWVVGRGISMGFQIREDGFEEPGLLGIPRYKIREAIGALWSMLTSKSRNQRFKAQLDFLDCCATLYGRHFY